MRVYGVDLGTRRLAIACPAIELVWSVDLTVGPGSAARKRQFVTELEAGQELGRLVTEFLKDWDAGDGTALFDPVFVAERPILRTVRPNVKVAVGMGLSAGAALSRLPGRSVLLGHPSLWKKALCGNGNASKDDVRAWIEKRHPTLAEACGQDEDRFDAVGIALGSAALASAGDL